MRAGIRKLELHVFPWNEPGDPPVRTLRLRTRGLPQSPLPPSRRGRGRDPDGVPRQLAGWGAALKVTAEAARRFLVARHFLAPARSLAGGLDGVLEVFRKLGSIQFDPIAVAGRNHDLVLHARVAGYEPAWCDVLYERREIFETTNKALSFVPASEFPWFRHDRGRKGPGSTPRPSPRTPRSPSACSSGSARMARCRRSTSSARAVRRRTGSGCRRTPCAPCSRRTPSRA